MKPRSLAIIILTVTVAGCATSQKAPSPDYASQPSANEPVDEDFDLLEEELAERTIEIADPLEPLNRLMFNFHEALQVWVMEPCAKLCKRTVPKPARIGIRNFFHNLTTPARFVNCILQWKGEAADRELHRFVVNTIEGVLGFGDPARDKLGIEPADEDLGQTLAVYGLSDGFYLVLPLLGPSTLRDSAGIVGDQFMNPARYVEPTEASIAASGTSVVNESTFHIGEYESFKEAAFEPYIAMREAYIQYRAKKIKE
jgi:phospholipid-binding lipoprotein MlaA